jgi:hypothetical protein
MPRYLLALLILALAVFTAFLACTVTNDQATPDAGGGRADTGSGAADAGGDGDSGGLGQAPAEAGDEAGDDAGPAGDASGDAGPCVIVASGAISGTFPCIADLAYDPATGTALALNAPSMPTLVFTSVLSRSMGVSPGSYTAADVVDAGSTYAASNGGAWLMAYNEPNHGNVGDFTIDVTSAGTAYTNSQGQTAWLGAYGTMTADLPAVPGDPFSSGTITLTAQWATVAAPPSDGGIEDAGDEGTSGNDCSATLTGALSATLGCTVLPTYVSGAAQTTFQVAIDPGDSGTIDSVLVDVSGELTTGTTYTPSSLSVVVASATVQMPVDGGTAAWQELTGDGGAGTFSLSFTTLGVEHSNAGGYTDIGAHGNYTATLPAAAGTSASGTVNLSIAF